MLLLETVGPALLVVAAAAVTLITAISYYRTSEQGDPGATTEIAALTTFLLGALAGNGQLLVAAAGGIGTALLLVAKPRLEAFSRALREEEVWAALELAVISGIVLPLLPSRGMGPWEALNPFDIWLVVVTVSALSFAGFVAARLLGEGRGLVVTAGLGSLVSSTAVTAAMALRSRETPESAAPAAAAVLASSVMCLRVVALSAAFGAGIVPRLLPAALAMTAVGVAAALWIARSPAPRQAAVETAAQVSNPFRLRTALLFGAIYAVTLLLVHAARDAFGSSGAIAVAALTSLADVDAVAIAFARSGAGETGWGIAAAAVSVAMVGNTLAKLVLALSLGAGSFRVQVARALAAMAAVGALAAVIAAR
jgi:uncharacterized membrane protein (DUF4010 family)